MNLMSDMNDSVGGVDIKSMAAKLVAMKTPSDEEPQLPPVEVPLIKELQEQPYEEPHAEQQLTAPEPAAPTEIKTDTKAEEGYRALRHAKERAEQERDDMARILREMHIKQQLQQSQSPQKEEYSDPEPEFNVGAEDLVEGKHIKALLQNQKKQQQQMQMYEEKLASYAIEAKLKALYPDFDNVVNSENLKKLAESEPDIANNIKSSTDLYSKAITAYKTIKKFGILPEDFNSLQDRQRILANNSKPRSVASVSPQHGESPLSRANEYATSGELTPELRAQLYKEMMAAAKKY